MRWFKSLWTFIDRASTLAWLWSLGGAALVAFGLGYGGEVVADIPQPWLGIGVGGAALLTMLALALLLPKVFPALRPSEFFSPVSLRLAEDAGTSAIQEPSLKEIRLQNALAMAEIEEAALRLRIEELSNPPPPDLLPVHQFNSELVRVLNTYGIPAFRILNDLNNDLLGPLDNDVGLIRFLPRLYKESWGQQADEALKNVESRLRQGPTSEDFYQTWDSFFFVYVQLVIFWTGTLVKELGATDHARGLVSKWMPLHDEYMKRIRELSNGDDGEAIKRATERWGLAANYRDRLLKLTEPPEVAASLRLTLMEPSREEVDQSPGGLWRVRLENDTPDTVAEAMNVRITGSDPRIELALPVTIHAMHDNDHPFQKSWNVRYGEPRVFDIIAVDVVNQMFYVYRADGDWNEQKHYAWMLSSLDNRVILKSAMNAGWRFSIAATGNPPARLATLECVMQWNGEEKRFAVSAS